MTATARARTVGVAVVLSLAALLAVGIVPRVENARLLTDRAERVRNAVPGVYVVHPVAAPTSALVLSGNTQAIQDAVIYARTSGYLTRRYVDIGDHVHTGQLLAEIQSPEVEQQLRQARADLLQAERTLDRENRGLELAQATMRRYEAAAGSEGAVAVEAVDQSVSAYRTAQASVGAARAAVDSNSANVDRLQTLTSFQRLVAPFDGVVVQRNVDVGALVTAGSPTDNTAVAPTSVTGAANGLFEVARLDLLRVFVNVPQESAASIHRGLSVRVSVPGHAADPIPATIARTANAVDRAARTLLCEIDIAKGPAWLLPGMFVTVSVDARPADVQWWRVPATAVVIDEHGTRVAAVNDDGVVHFQAVTIARDLGASIDIETGLRGNETIVSQPAVTLQEQQRVKPVPEPPAH